MKARIDLKRFHREFIIVEENLRTIEEELKLPHMVDRVTPEEMEDQSDGLQELYQQTAKFKEPLKIQLTEKIHILQEKYERLAQLLMHKANIIAPHFIDPMFNQAKQYLDNLEQTLRTRPSLLSQKKIDIAKKELTTLLEVVQSFLEPQKTKWAQSIQSQLNRVDHLQAEASLYHPKPHSEPIKIVPPKEEPEQKPIENKDEEDEVQPSMQLQFETLNRYVLTHNLKLSDQPRSSSSYTAEELKIIIKHISANMKTKHLTSIFQTAEYIAPLQIAKECLEKTHLMQKAEDSLDKPVI